MAYPIQINERLTFDKLFRISEPRRVYRSFTVKGPPLEIDSYQDVLYYIFNFKANPSTTGLRHRGYVKFFKPKLKNPKDVPLQHLECLVDCTCPDFRYRYSWSNKQRQSSVVGPQSLNQAWNKAPRKTNPQGLPGLCVAEGELVTTQAGYIPIQTVKIGDMVWTLKGWNKVLASARTGYRQIVEVSTLGGRKLRLTANHPVYTYSAQTSEFEWVDAGKLVAGQQLCCADPSIQTWSPDYVKTVSAGASVDVYDLTVENAEHFAVNGVIVHNCKHLLATRRFIYGLLSSFAGDQKDTAEKLNHLTKYATKRWTDFEGQMRAAKAKEAEFKRRRNLRNAGQLPAPSPATAAAPSTAVTPPDDSTDLPDAPAGDLSPELGVPPAPPELPLPLPPDEPAKGVRIQNKNKPGGGPKNKSKRPPEPGDDSWIKPQESYLMVPLRDLILESVVSTNGDIMSKINDALKLVEEMEADELQHLNDAPSSAGLDLGGAADGVDPSLEPSEPPVSDSAVGADTEGDSALGLLRSMKTSLEQIAAAVAPVEELPPGPAGAEGAVGQGEMPGEMGGAPEMPDEPPVDGEEVAEVEDEEGDEPFKGKGDKGEKGGRKKEGRREPKEEAEEID